MASERTALLRAPSRDGACQEQQQQQQQETPAHPHFSPWRLFIASLTISLSWSYTQTPQIYAFHQMQCEDYYLHNPPYTGHGDRCGLSAIKSGSAAQYAIMGMSNIFFAIANLFFTGWQMKRVGPKRALVVQNFFLFVRVLIQSVALGIGAAPGIVIMQLSQIVTIVGGPAGYILVLNTILADITEQSQRTAVFGRLQGFMMVGNAGGFLVGGFVSDHFGVDGPFKLAALCFIVTCAYCVFAIPSVQLSTDKADSDKAKKSTGFVATLTTPVRALGPQKLRLKDGRVVKHYGIAFLASGIFVGTLATGYVGNLLQMYSKDSFDFPASKNSMLMALTLVVRGLFLVVIFPKIISSGRKWYDQGSRHQVADTVPDGQPVVPTDPLDIDPTPRAITVEEEPIKAVPAKSEEQESGHFDLFFLRWSYLLDGILTMTAAFIAEGWEFYLLATLLPFASGSAPAAKGVLTEMVPAAQKADAIQGMTLVEYTAIISTLGLFGLIYSTLIAIDKASYTFYVNAAVAVLAIGVLLFSRFPPEGSELVHDEEDEEEPLVSS